MKKTRNLIGLIVLLVVGLVIGAEYLFGINLLTEFFIDDTNPPEIHIGNLPSKVVVDTPFTLNEEEISCEDDYDRFCRVDIQGSVDTSVVGEYTILVSATDSAGNTETINFIVEVVEGVDGSFYIPTGYYDGIEGLTGESLKNALNDIITNHTEFPYTDDDTDVWDMLRDADEDPNNPDNVILFYSGFSWPKECQDTNTDLLPDYCFEGNNREADYTEWNREHIWSKSHGDFEDEGDYAYEEASGGYALGAHTDGHHLVAAERSMNSVKNNRFFADCHDGVEDDNLVDRGYGNYTCGEWYFEPRDEVKGDVARMLFYMVIRYEGEQGDFVDLELTTDLYQYENAETSIKNSKLPYYEDLEVLLRWHLEDPVSEWEILRNQTIYEYQGNRNPFIDIPELVEEIWGTPENPVDYSN